MNIAEVLRVIVEHIPWPNQQVRADLHAAISDYEHEVLGVGAEASAEAEAAHVGDAG